MKLRDYEARDFERCMAIARSNVPEFLDASEPAIFERFLRTKIGAEGIWYAVIEIDDVVQACGGLSKEPDGHRNMLWGLVHRSVHRQGLGSRLTKERIERAGGDEIRMDTSQHTAAFYERFGFVATGREENGYGPGLHRIEMRRNDTSC